MSEAERQIESELDRLKSNEKSSPAGHAWHLFYEHLCGRKRAGEDPPPPLILAASGESDFAKHDRLAAQLRWAAENDCLEMAIAYLRRLPSEKWNTAPVEQWGRSSYPE
jgi:hypothetical protein